MFTISRRTVALLGATAATGLAAAGCGGGHGDHGAGVTTSTSPTATQNAVDRAFVTQMVPHHESAIVMAADAPSRAQHDELKTLATSISTSQRAEIGQLRAVAKQLGVTPAAGTGHDSMGHAAGHGGSSSAASAKALGLSEDAMGMSMDMAALKTAKPFDRAFIDEMIPHHQGAIRMARAELEGGRNTKLKQIALSIVADQQDEIRRMNAWRKAWYGAESPAGGVPPAT